MNRKQRRKRKKLEKPGPKAKAPPASLAAAARHLQSGRFSDAAEAFREALDAGPGDAPAHCGLAAALVGLGRLEDAASSYRQAIEIEPDFADAHYNLGVVLQQQGDPAGAAAQYQRAIALNPGSSAAHTNLGAAFDALGKADDAIDCYRRALEIDPSHVRALSNLGAALQGRKKPDQAVAVLEDALAIDPRFTEALNNMGNALVDLGRLGDAVDHFRRAIALRPDFAEAHHNLGNTLKKDGRLDEAAASLERAIGINPDYAEAHWNLSHVLLLQGRLAEGWREHEWRWRCAGVGVQQRDFPQPLWQGEPPAGKTIVVWGEQGVGDEILFAGMIPDLVEAGADVVIESDRRLAPLFQRSFPDTRCIVQTDPPAAALGPSIDYQTPSGSLGRWLRPGRDSYPGRASYLAADPGRRAAIRERYRGGDKSLLVGIAWSSVNPDIGAEKSLSLIDLKQVLTVPGVRLVDLQYGDTAADRGAFEAATGAAILHDNDIDQMADLDAFAAQIAALDLVVTVSNTTAHMAGALGLPVWVMLNTVPLCCWMMEGTDSPWYPSARLFRQQMRGDWSRVLADVGTALRRRLGA